MVKAHEEVQGEEGGTRMRKKDRAKTDKWVKKLNKLAAEIDEIATTTHPSAWPEQMGDLPEKWKKLAVERWWQNGD